MSTAPYCYTALRIMQNVHCDWRTMKFVLTEENKVIQN